MPRRADDQLTGAFAEFERTMIRQRVKAGLKRAVAQGVKLGRPKIDSATGNAYDYALKCSPAQRIF